MSFSQIRFGDIFHQSQKNGLTRPKKVRGAGVPMVNMGELFAHPRIHNLPMDRVPLAESESAFLLSPGDLLFARQSLVLAGAGQCSIFLGNNEPTTFESHLIRCRLDSKRVNPSFYFNFFRSPEGRRVMEAIVEQGAGASGIRGSDLINVLVPCPPLHVQNEVAATLDGLDDRITLLRETNATLEAIAQAIFKSWFVDFDPVRAKQEGRAPEGMDEATAALFPDSFEESALGLVPMGWGAIPFSETVSIMGGGTPKTSVPEFWGGEVPWFSVVDAPGPGQVFTMRTEKSITSAGVDNSSTRVLPAWTTIISARGTVGKLAMTARPMAMNQSCYGLRPKVFGTEPLVYLAAQRLVDELKRLAHGGVFDTITRDTLSSVRVAQATPGVQEAFAAIVKPVFEKIQLGVERVLVLSDLRDTLLPRLISGKLRLPEAEKITEELTR